VCHRDGSVGATKIEKALLQNLIAGAGSSSQLIGGLIVALLYVVIGLLSAIGSILIVRRIFRKKGKRQRRLLQSAKHCGWAVLPTSCGQKIETAEIPVAAT
jgi:hypothetical protein